MPPKQKSKADLAKKQKIVEDNIFGLKNKKKSKNARKYVQGLNQNVEPEPDPSKVAGHNPARNADCASAATNADTEDISDDNDEQDVDELNKVEASISRALINI